MSLALKAESAATCNETVLAAKAVIRGRSDLSEKAKELLCTILHDIYCLGYSQGMQAALTNILKDFNEPKEL